MRTFCFRKPRLPGGERLETAAADPVALVTEAAGVVG